MVVCADGVAIEGVSLPRMEVTVEGGTGRMPVPGINK
jgi:hypothetical protein